MRLNMASLVIFSILILDGFCRIIEQRKFGTDDCSILAIITGKTKENADCNLKNLLQKEYFPQKRERVRSSRKRTILQFEIGTCQVNEPCRVSGKRTCLCPKSFVCEPGPSGDYSCVKLGFYTIFGR
ncbi:unnamed protein product [Caenorhabditis bovis]|uniref:EB domain-containing protein n=1 Tax=Caenorhabditis bovis TaxID=2654633 RepID=A0A8S1E447_9PELO|nr:unnamed protein product [Caenorhabditis bovis]